MTSPDDLHTLSNPWENIIWSGLVYGNPGLGKTFFAASLPKPMKVFQFDPPAKGLAYLQQGHAQPIVKLPDGGALQYIVDDKGALVVEIEYFMDLNPQNIGTDTNPCAYERFQVALHNHMGEEWMTAEDKPRKYASVILDSYTFCEMACFRMQKFKMNPAPGGVEDGKHNQMQWGGAASAVLLVDIVSTWPWIPCHSLVLAHVNDQKFDEQEKQLYGISAIGKKLPIAMPGAFAEVYLMFAQYNEKEKKYENLLMTERNGAYMAQSHIGSPNPCQPTWEALWK